jgi:hypothetical protein
MNSATEYVEHPDNHEMTGVVTLCYNEATGMVLAEGVCTVSGDTLPTDEECQEMFEGVVANILAGGEW